MNIRRAGSTCVVAGSACEFEEKNTDTWSFDTLTGDLLSCWTLHLEYVRIANYNSYAIVEHKNPQVPKEMHYNKLL